MRAGVVRPAYALLLALLVVAPLLRPGYLLLRDAVSTPQSYLSDTALGLSSAPRATPQDFAVALASSLVDGGIVVKALLVLGLWLAGLGAARLVAVVLPSTGLGGQFVAITLSIWNPYVAERLLQGHWSLLVGYGCLPWVAVAMLRRSFFELGFWVALAGLTPTGLLLAATVALACLAAPGAGRLRWLGAALGVAVVAALPWLAAAVAGSSLNAATGGPGVAVFAARAEPGLGTLASLASLGGIWNGQAVPDSRATLFALFSAAVLLGVVLLGVPAAVRRPAAVPLLALAAAAIVVPACLATGPGLHLLRAVVDAAPGLGVLRDGQKWVALAMPGYASAGAGAVVMLGRWLKPLRPLGAAVVCCLAVVLALPDLAWGVWGRVEPVHYPAGWATVAAAINARPGPVAVLPAGAMRRFAWSGPAPVLDPLQRWVRADVLATGDLDISGVTVPGESRHARAVQELLMGGPDPSALVSAGVAWLVVEADSPGDMGSSGRTLDRLSPVYRDQSLALYRVGGQGVPARGRAVVLAAHWMWLAMLVGCGAGAVVSRWRRACSEGAKMTKMSP